MPQLSESEEAQERTMPPAELCRRLGVSILASAAFGAAVAVGRGAGAMLHGAWAAPALVVGGAALALPPLYLATALGGGQSAPGEVAASAAGALSRVTTVLLGLAAPTLFFSVTLQSLLGTALLVTVLVTVGTLGVVLVARDALSRETGGGARLGIAAWSVFALALGARLMATVGGAAGVFGGT